MDLKIIIIDEDEIIVEEVSIYQDGSDSEGAARIVEMLHQEFECEDDESTLV